MDTIEEFGKKYQNTYCRVRIKDHWQPAIIGQHSPQTQQVIFTLADSSTGTFKYPESFENVDLEVPATGYFNYKNHALLLFRLPARQWRRGLCSDNHEIFNPFRRLLPNEGGFFYKPAWGMQLADALYKRALTHDPNRSIRLLNEGLASSAITRDLAISLSPTSAKDGFLVWYKANPVGRINKANKFVITDELYEQEVIDSLRRSGHHAWIS